VEIVAGFISWHSFPEPFQPADPVIRKAFRTNVYFVGPFSHSGYQQK
jgi:hypothetical protein